jgi:hypothetical protein
MYTEIITSDRVLAFLRPEGNYIQIGDTYEGIEFLEGCRPLTKEDYEAGFAQYSALKSQQEADKAAARAALFARLGITAEEAALLLGGTN